LIKSVVHSDTEAIKAILKLHCKGHRIDLDPTYSTGGFYKKGVTQPRFCFDIDPKVPGVTKADAAWLPLRDESMRVIIFDPPFLATTGPSLKKKNKSNRLNKRFGVFPNEPSLFKFYEDAIKELYRVCEDDGILIFKCQDKVSSGKQYFSHCFIYNKAVEAGWYAKDLFVLLAKHRLIADWQKVNQKHARKHHCYYFVFEKK
jgi:tRNA G10  N-methylase Trm11